MRGHVQDDRSRLDSPGSWKARRAAPARAHAPARPRSPAMRRAHGLSLPVLADPLLAADVAALAARIAEAQVDRALAPHGRGPARSTRPWPGWQNKARKCRRFNGRGFRRVDTPAISDRGPESNPRQVHPISAAPGAKAPPTPPPGCADLSAEARRAKADSAEQSRCRLGRAPRHHSVHRKTVPIPAEQTRFLLSERSQRLRAKPRPTGRFK